MPLFRRSQKFFHFEKCDKRANKEGHPVSHQGAGRRDSNPKISAGISQLLFLRQWRSWFEVAFLTDGKAGPLSLGGSGSVTFGTNFRHFSPSVEAGFIVFGVSPNQIIDISVSRW